MNRFSKLLKRFRLLFAVLIALTILTFVAVRVSAPMLQPAQLGPVDGQLRDCPEKPNCVCSQEEPDDLNQLVEPLRGDWATLVAAVKADRATAVVQESEGYLWVTYRSKLMGYLDDVEFLRGPEEVIHVRSASRLGHSDLGTNRKRVEALRRSMASPANET